MSLRRAAIAVPLIAVGLSGCGTYVVRDDSDPCTPARRAVQAAVKTLMTRSTDPVPSASPPPRILPNIPGLIADAETQVDEVRLAAAPGTYWDRLYQRYDTTEALDAGITREVTERREVVDAIDTGWQALAACRIRQARSGDLRRSLEALRLKHDEDLRSVRIASAVANRWQTRYDLVAFRLGDLYPTDSPKRAQLRGPAAIEAFAASANGLAITVSMARDQSRNTFGDP